MSLFSMMVKLSIRKPCGLLSLRVTFLRWQVVTSDLSVTLLVAFLLQVPVVTDGTFIRKVKGTLDVAFNGALVR